jgi:hypothetical protein
MEVVAGEAGEMERESCHFLGVQFVVLWKNIKIRESRRKNWRRSWVQAKRTKKKDLLCNLVLVLFYSLHSNTYSRTFSISHCQFLKSNDFFFAIVKNSSKNIKYKKFISVIMIIKIS